MFERRKNHLKYLKDTKESALRLHSLHHHQGREGVPYSMSVTATGTFSEPLELDIQIMEKVQVSRYKGYVSKNRKIGWGGHY